MASLITIDTILERLELFMQQYDAAPEFGGQFNKIDRKKELSKGQLLQSFVLSLKMFKCIADKDVQDKVDSVIDNLKKEFG